MRELRVPGDDPPWLRGVEGAQVRPLITLDAPVLRVPSGPGTGKTFGLRKRVLRLLHPDGRGLDSNEILVCAFNRVIAEELRNELAGELEPYGLEVPVVRTIHGLAGELSGERPRFLLDHEVELMVYDVLTSVPELRAVYGGYADTARAVREYEAGVEGHEELAAAANEWLQDHRASLVGDLPRQVEAAVHQDNYLGRRFTHVIVDEFQDLTATEARLAVGLRAPGGQLVALGDRKQSIYGFRRNEERGLAALPDLVDDEVLDHQMVECRRCPREIVYLGNELMADYGEPLVDVRGAGGQIHQVVFATPHVEHRRMAAEIVRVYGAHPQAKHLALVTRREWGYRLRAAIRDVDPEVNAQTVFSEDVLQTWPAREAFIFLSALADPTDPVTHRDWIAYRRPNEEGGRWKGQERHAPVYRAAREAGGLLSSERLLQIAADEVSSLSGTGRGEVHHRAIRFRELLADVPRGATPPEIVAHVLTPDLWVSDETADPESARHDMERLKAEADRMFAEAEEHLSLSDLASRLRNRIATREPIGQDSSPAIKIVTLWGAKGLTADYVYLVGLCDEALPGPYDPTNTILSEEEDLLEKERLLYVSLTRAKRSLALSRPSRILQGEAANLGLTRRAGFHWQELSQCRFLAPLPERVLPAEVSGDDWEGIAA